MSLDPKNLGKPVYDADQVILVQDLRVFIDELDSLCEMDEMTDEEIIAYNAVIETLLTLQDWLLAGKKMNISWSDHYSEEI